MIGHVAIPLMGFDYDKLTKVFEYEGMALLRGNEFMKTRMLIPGVVNVIGTAVADRLMESPVFYSIIDSGKEIADFKYSSDFMCEKVRWLFLGLWFVKDNSLGYPYSVVVNEDEHTAVVVMPGGHYFNYKGEISGTDFTNKEFEQAANIAIKIEAILAKSDNQLKVVQIGKDLISQSITEVQEHNLGNRVTRAIMFLQEARQTRYLLSRMGWLINVYECLFTTETTELAHRIGEKTASYLSRDKTERAEIYKFIKKCYSIRSRFFHGQDVDKKLSTDKLTDAIGKLENLTRCVLMKAINNDFDNFSLPKNPFDEWLLSLLFDVNTEG
jgi:hypothetical protein